MTRGKALKFGDDISTDQIVPSKYLSSWADNIGELAKHAMEDADPQFVNKVKAGDFVVAGESFGIGSSREQAPLVLKKVGISAVLVRSAGRIFFRNAINVGLPVLVCDTGKINDGDDLEVNFETGTLENLTTGERVSFAPLPSVMIHILREGGLVPYVKKVGAFKL
jgi:3-isopropylmalate/(R)-2-methylmalate dehydratase small subunit